MAACRGCGKVNPDHYAFCLGCGQELTPGVGAESRSDRAARPRGTTMLFVVMLAIAGLIAGLIVVVST